MSHARLWICTSAVVSLSGLPARAQANGDSTAAAVAATERALHGRTVVRRTMAVLPFSVTSADTTYAALGYGLAEFLSDDLTKARKIMMVERADVTDMQREKDLSASGAVEQATKVRSNRMIGAQDLIFGTIDVGSGGKLNIDERAVVVESGEVEARLHVSSSTDDIFDAERDLVTQTLSAMGNALTPKEAQAIRDRPAPNFKAFLAFSRGVRAERQGNAALAVASYKEATTLDRNFTLAAARLGTAHERSAAHSPRTKADTSQQNAARPAKTPKAAAARRTSPKAVKAKP